MRLLLDTHTLLWAFGAPRRLPRRLESMLLDERNQVHCSAVSILEISIARAAGRRNAPAISAAKAAELAVAAGYALLLMTEVHAAAVETIALFHGDPFDRLLLAQAQVEGLRLVTHDEAIASYDARTILY